MMMRCDMVELFLLLSEVERRTRRAPACQPGTVKCIYPPIRLHIVICNSINFTTVLCLLNSLQRAGPDAAYVNLRPFKGDYKGQARVTLLPARKKINKSKRLSTIQECSSGGNRLIGRVFFHKIFLTKMYFFGLCSQSGEIVSLKYYFQLVNYDLQTEELNVYLRISILKKILNLLYRICG